MEKSIILPWNVENANNAPSKCGVFALRSTPVNGDILFLSVSENLKDDILKSFENDEFEGKIKYFDWYATDNLEEAEKLKSELIEKHHLEF